MKEPALTGRNDPDHSECFAIQKKYHERVQSDQVVIEKYEDIIKSLVAQQSKVCYCLQVLALIRHVIF